MQYFSQHVLQAPGNFYAIHRIPTQKISLFFSFSTFGRSSSEAIVVFKSYCCLVVYERMGRRFIIMSLSKTLKAIKKKWKTSSSYGIWEKTVSDNNMSRDWRAPEKMRKQIEDGGWMIMATKTFFPSIHWVS